ncbi:MAG: hemerythrin domain-containing protein [Burkholderiales bacterium]|nr:hemerythrin domain-containing protein [Burkholderiales bacterium]
MASIEEFMSRHHKSCDAHFAAAEAAAGDGDWSAAAREFDAFAKGMAHHFEMEEAVLFPAFEERTGMDGGPTYVMREEHEQMRGVLAALKSAVAAKDTDEYLGQAETLNVLMQQHNIKEEQVLYRMMDQHLGGEADMLLGRFDEVAAA